VEAHVIAIPGKPPLHLRVSVTDRCQLRCRYCMPPEGVPLRRHQDILRYEEIVEFVGQLQRFYDVRKVRLTGGDPLARRGIAGLVASLSGLGIADLAMTTNAQGLAGMAAELRSAGLHRINISLDSLRPDTFRRITRGGDLRKTLAGIDAALAAELRPVKLNMVVLGGVNDTEVEEMLSFAIARACEMRFLEVMPVGNGHVCFDAAFVPADSVKKRLAGRFSMSPLPFEPGSSARRYTARRADGVEGVVGFIAPCSDPFCAGCARLRLTAGGRLIGCLAREEGRDVRPLLRQGGEALAEAVQEVLQGKRDDGRFEQPVPMAAIGG
jgi:cyclic pyranopterin phosphate synthase